MSYSEIQISVIKSTICQIGKRLYERNMVAGCDGNISIKVSDGVWITPTGVSKGFMDPEMIVKIDFEGNLIEGNYTPTSEMYMHLAVYDSNPEITSVVHAHPPMSCVFAAANMPIDSPILIESVYGLGAIPVAPYFEPGTKELADSVRPFTKDFKGCLLAHHGAVTWGKGIIEAMNRMETLEQCANVLFNLRLINKEKYIPGRKPILGGENDNI